MLKEFRETKGLSQQELADALSDMGSRWTQADVSRIERGKIRPTIDKIKQAADYFGVTQGAMLGEGPSVVYNNKEKNKESIKIPLQPKIEERIAEVQFGPDMVPILGHASGSSEVVMLNINEPIGEAPRHPNQKGMKNSYYVRLYDETMAPRYYARELAAVAPGMPPTEEEDCIVIMKDDSFVVRKFIKFSDKEIICRQLNPAKDWKRQRSEIKAIHAVVGRG